MTEHKFNLVLKGVNALSGLISFLQRVLQYRSNMNGVNALSGLISFLRGQSAMHKKEQEVGVNALSGLISFLPNPKEVYTWKKKYVSMP